jgi:diguanylate cyclase (GGDEF)-like protein
VGYTCRVGALIVDKPPSALSARYRTFFLFGVLGAVLLLCGSALYFYKNTQQLLAVRDLESHSLQVLALLETSEQRLEQLDYLGRLYLTDKNKDDLNTIRATATQLDINLTRLKDLLWNSEQISRAQSAHDCAQQLTTQVNHLVLPGTDADKISLTRKVQQCRSIVTSLEEEGETLLKQRTQTENRDTYRNLVSGVVSLAVSLAVVLVLFGLLLRDFKRRIESERQLFDTNEQLESTVKALGDELSAVQLRAAVREELQLCATPAEAHQVIVRYFARAVPGTKIALLTVNSSQQILEIAATNDDDSEILDGVPVNSCCAFRGARSRYRRPGVSEVDCTHFRGAPPQSYLCMPLAAHGEALGVVYVGCPDATGCPSLDHEIPFLRGLTELSSMWLGSLNLRARLEEESIRDGLTNLFNRRFMEIALERELRLAVRSKTELSLLMLDIDHFKRFNDTFGHDAGDQVLREVADILSASVRAEDIVCRYGGEEFLLILPGMGTDGSFQRAEEIRKSVSMMRLEFQGKGVQEITTSIGVSTYPQAGYTVDELIRAADQALYKAKESGRNRVVFADSAIVV